MRCRPDTDPHRRLIGCYEQGVARIIVLALVERTQQPDARLNGDYAAFCGDLDHCIMTWTFECLEIVRLSTGVDRHVFRGTRHEIKILQPHISTQDRYSEGRNR